MKIGIPKEIKPLEGRVALVPDAVAELVALGHELYIEQGAGTVSGYADALYERAGATIAADAAVLYGTARLIVKVKEPIEPELSLLRSDHLLFSFLHLAAAPSLTQSLCQTGLTAIAFETVVEGGQLPLLAPMSDIAGRLSVQIGSNLLQSRFGGKGLLLGGLPAAERGRVVILGGGVAGGSAAIVAAGLGAEVVVFDKKRERLEVMRAIGPNVTGLYAYGDSIEREISRADLLIGAVLIPGMAAPKLVSKEQIAAMAPGSVVVDIAIDQGGCIETSRPTDYRDPTYIESGVVHFAVTNMPGTVPRSASQALSAAISPYVAELAADSWVDHKGLSEGVNIKNGEVVLAALLA